MNNKNATVHAFIDDYESGKLARINKENEIAYYCNEQDQLTLF